MTHIDGIGEWKAALKAKRGALLIATQVATTKGLHMIERDTKKVLKTYTHPRGTPTTSPPGEPPALVTGTLRRSMTVRGPVWSGMSVTGEVGPTVVYARIQELGGRAGKDHRATLPARPYVLPTVLGDLARIRNLYRREWNRALRR